MWSYVKDCERLALNAYGAVRIILSKMTTNYDIEVRQFTPFLPNCTEIKAFFSAVFEKGSFDSVHNQNFKEDMRT